jgi:predicted HTH transcriptional regulator
MKIDEEWLGSFFHPVDEQNILKRRESTGIEFKECFNWPSKDFKSNIGKSAAAFSNNAGGVIIFGIGNKPHKIIGVDSFEIDEADISHFFNEHFSPYIDFSLHTCEIAGKTIGLMQIYEAKKKPVICIKDSPKTCDSDIYFRYNAKSSKIKSGDLNHLLSQLQESNNKKWLDLFTKVSTVGISNISLLNKISGEMDSPGTTQKFLLDESLLDQIKILDRHSISEIGAPAVRIVGEIIETTSVINRTKSLHEEDIFKAFY